LLGGALGLTAGGRVRGPGKATSDSIPAMLSDGDHRLHDAIHVFGWGVERQKQHALHPHGLRFKTLLSHWRFPLAS
ncbi:hypothetical protein, partial [Mesorhizobium sp.]|uniref:hypothetical protein n=1 Tax=Mesorhizobium sp. TaxID=1871066 RepID=UPI00257EACDA